MALQHFFVRDGLNSAFLATPSKLGSDGPPGHNDPTNLGKSSPPMPQIAPRVGEDYVLATRSAPPRPCTRPVFGGMLRNELPASSGLAPVEVLFRPMNVDDIRLTCAVGQVVPAENHIKADFLVLLRKIRNEAA